MNILLFFIATFFWGSAWFPIKFQMGYVTPFWSLAYRFGIAGIMLLGYCVATKLPLSFNWRQHCWIALQGLLFCSFNYILYYFAFDYLVSGIVATISATIIIMNVVNTRIFFKSPIEMKTIVGGLIGILGLIFTVWAEFVRLEDKPPQFLIEGLLLALGATLVASFGQITIMANLKRGLPLIQTIALGFIYGFIFISITALALNEMPTFDFSLPYSLSLLYLSLAGTAFAFLTYFALAKRIGLDKSAYSFVLAPVFAMIISSLFGELTWTGKTILGVCLILIGNILVMAKKWPSWKFWRTGKPSATD